MPARQNPLKQRLARGETTIGLWVGLAGAYAAEIAAQTGFDWVLLDGEHAPNDVRALSEQLGAALGRGSEVAVRLVDDNPAAIKQALDAGAQSILIPMVESVEQAARIVRATRYPPNGFRGVGSSLARASGFNAVPDYLTTADEQICLMLQVESRKGLAAMPGILALEGVDSVFIGPSDLAADMGHLGNPGHPEVKAAVLEALRTIRAAGKAAGVLTLDPDFIREVHAAGANFIAVGIDVLTLVQGLRDLSARWKGEIGG